MGECGSDARQLGPFPLGTSGQVWIMTQKWSTQRDARAGIFIHHLFSITGGMLPLGALNSLTPWPVSATKAGLRESCSGIVSFRLGWKRRNKGRTPAWLLESAS